MPARVEPREGVVVDASAIVELLCGTELAEAVRERLSDERLLAPAHIDAEVLSALGRLQRAGGLTEEEVAERLQLYAEAPLERRPLPPLLVGAWARRHNLRLVDAFYVELAAQLDDAPLLTTDSGMASACPSAELLGT